MTLMRAIRRSALLLCAVLVSGCALTSDVAVSPLRLNAGDITHRTTSVSDLVESGDYTAAIAFASGKRLGLRELAALGRAEMAAAHYDAAREHLKAALGLNPYRTDAAQIAWDLSQTEYLSNNFAAAREWAEAATKYGISVKDWHLQYLEALTAQPVYGFSGATSARMLMSTNTPAIPRIRVKVNGDHNAVAVIDSGAVLSIISEEFAKELSIRSLGDFEGTFFGLLGEPISVRFGLVETLELGKMVVHNVPVAIMPDAKLNFFVANKKPFKMDLLLGANLLKEFRIELDFRHSRAEFTRLAVADRNPAPNQNLFFVGFRPFVHATINRKGWFLFVLDTGSEISFLNEAEIASTPIWNSPKYHGAMLQGLGGATKRGVKIEKVSIGVDQWSGFFRDLPLYHTEQTRSLGIIGENFLNQFIVRIDFGTMRVDLEHEDMFADAPDTDEGS